MPLRDYTVTWASLKDDSNDMSEAGWGAGYGWSRPDHSLAVVPPVWAGMFAALESFMPGPGAQLVRQACHPEQQAGLEDG